MAYWNDAREGKMPKHSAEEWVTAKKQWIPFIKLIMSAYRFKPVDLARKLGVSPWTVYRWLDPAPSPKGTLPPATARTLLVQLARERGLVDSEGK